MVKPPKQGAVNRRWHKHCVGTKRYNNYCWVQTKHASWPLKSNVKVKSKHDVADPQASLTDTTTPFHHSHLLLEFWTTSYFFFISLNYYQKYFLSVPIEIICFLIEFSFNPYRKCFGLDMINSTKEKKTEIFVISDLILRTFRFYR